jgi:hypothetical protein
MRMQQLFSSAKNCVVLAENAPKLVKSKDGCGVIVVCSLIP